MQGGPPLAGPVNRAELVFVRDAPQISKSPGAYLAREHFKSSEATYCPQNTAQNLQASDRPQEGRLIQRRAY